MLPFTRKEEVEADEEEEGNLKALGRIIPFKPVPAEVDQQARRFTYQSLHWTRVADMRTLREMRGPTRELMRETTVFLMLNALAQSGQVNARNFPYETAALARECDSFIEGTDLVQEHMGGRYGQGEGLYRYSNQKLIEQLEITPDEERHMRTLISTSEKYRRRNERRNEARGYQSKRVERAKKIVELHRAGLSLRQIAVVVGCGRMTVARELESPLLIAIDSLTY